MENEQVLKIMNEIVHAIGEAGYNPYNQLVGYLMEGDEKYITRRGGAREKIRQLSVKQIRRYIDTEMDR